MTPDEVEAARRFGRQVEDRLETLAPLLERARRAVQLAAPTLAAAAPQLAKVAAVGRTNAAALRRVGR